MSHAFQKIIPEIYFKSLISSVENISSFTIMCPANSFFADSESKKVNISSG